MIKPGWTGRFFEDVVPQNIADLHFDAHYAAQTEWGRPLVDSTFTRVTGQSVTDVSEGVMANLGWDEVRLPAAVFEGDTIYSESEVLEVRDSSSHAPARNRPRPVDA
jgi:itaconyl-CoA hydratase